MNQEAYCVKCRRHSEIVNPRLVELNNNRHQLRGNCVGCGIDIGKFISNDVFKKYKHYVE